MRQDETCHRVHNGGGLPKALFSRTVSCGQVSLRVPTSTERITELPRLTHGLVRCLRPPWRLPRAGGRFRDSENKGESDQAAWSLNDIATTDLRTARTKKGGRADIAAPGPDTALGSSVRARGRFSGRLTKSPGKSTVAALPTWHPVQFFRCCRYFLRVHGHFRRKNNLGNIAKVALRADFWSATGSSLARGRLRREIDNGDTAVVATSLTWCAGVGLSRLVGDVRRGTTQRRRRRRSASLNLFADVTLVRTGGRRRRGSNKGEPAETATSLNYCAGIGLRLSGLKTAAGHTGEATPPRRHLVGLHPFGVVNSAERITELRRLTRPLVRFLRRPWRLLCGRGRFLDSENKGRSARMAWSLNHIATTDLLHA